jgi:hypothetical protein
MPNMRKETIVQYIADDGTPFEDREACEAYDAVYHKCYKMIEHGKVFFWNADGEFIRDRLLSYTWNKVEQLCYYDWLKKQLNNIAYFRINTETASPEFEEIWGLLRGLLSLDKSREPALYVNYETGDTCMLDGSTGRYVNRDDVARSFNNIKKELDKAVAEEFKKFMEGLCK